jgi:hypothetical protein
MPVCQTENPSQPMQGESEAEYDKPETLFLRRLERELCTLLRTRFHRGWTRLSGRTALEFQTERKENQENWPQEHPSDLRFARALSSVVICSG